MAIWLPLVLLAGPLLLPHLNAKLHRTCFIALIIHAPSLERLSLFGRRKKYNIAKEDNNGARRARTLVIVIVVAIVVVVETALLFGLLAPCQQATRRMRNVACYFFNHI